ncbi:MAG TPA: DUF167 domain-containing protein [Aquifex aeolicus]|uniref:UPF0235 protein ENJ61_03955 n=1 Tax=Aquifex aeolicus TaxID=63363 RepID=A0A7C5QI23_AQUAO|nr:DUF167 domain-containing protein [Aquifex aeolicus]
MILKVRVRPGAREESVRELSGDELEVRVSAPPQKGKANERVRELLAEHFGVSRSRVRILKGESSRRKLIEIDL